MEVIGVVAATTQLLGILMKVYTGIAELRDRMKFATARIQRFQDELACLGDIVCQILNNEALQIMPNLESILLSIGQKIATLNELLAKTFVGPKSPGFGTRVVRAFREKLSEGMVTQTFKEIERNKTTLLLILNISQPSHNMSLKTSQASRRSDDMSTESTPLPPEISAALHETDPQLSRSVMSSPGRVCLPPSRLSQGKLANLIDRHEQLLCTRTMPMDPPNESTSTFTFQCPSSNTMPTSERNTYANIKLKGDFQFVGSELGTGRLVDFRDITANGMYVVIGEHGENGPVARATAMSIMVGAIQKTGGNMGTKFQGIVESIAAYIQKLANTNPSN